MGNKLNEKKIFFVIESLNSVWREAYERMKFIKKRSKCVSAEKINNTCDK